MLNTTAILSFTALVRKAQVNNDTAHNRYPVHSFGRLSPKNSTVVAKTYIPYLASQLKQAVKKGDSPKIQVYIRALGNTAHPKILEVFEPYLEGEEDMSDFQRLVIVASLDQMTMVYPKLARSVLYKIYKNPGEAHQVRIAAVMQIMKTNPPAEILQRMAQYSNVDNSKQVRSAVKSAIESAARMESNTELARNAKAAVNLLTRKEYGFQYSKDYIRQYIVKQQDLGYEQHLAYIQGEDSIVPSTMAYSLRRRIGGYNREKYQFNLYTSSADDLMDLLSDQFADQTENQHIKKNQQAKQIKSGGKWSADQLLSLLNIQVDEADQVEGNLYVTSLGAKRFVAWDNHSIEALPYRE
jgi:hypothetical protein